MGGTCFLAGSSSVMTAHAEKTGRRILEEESVFAGCQSSSRHAAGAKAVPLYSDGLDQLLHPADLRGHLLSQDLIAAFQAPKLALEDVGGLHGEPGLFLALPALGLSAMQLLTDVAQVTGDALVLFLVPTLFLLIYGQQRRHIFPARALVVLQILQAFLYHRYLLEDL